MSIGFRDSGMIGALTSPTNMELPQVLDFGDAMAEVLLGTTLYEMVQLSFATTSLPTVHYPNMTRLYYCSFHFIFHYPI